MARNRARYRIGWLFFLYFIVTVFQYCDLWANSVGAQSTATYWKVDASDLDSAGVFKYAKDVYLFLITFYLVMVIFRSRDQPFRAAVFKFWLFLLIFTTSMLVGQILEPRLIFMAAGFRWLLLFNFCVTLSLYAIYNADRFYRPRVLVTFSFAMRLLGSFVVLFALGQWVSYGMPSVLGLRFFSVFTNAGVFGLCVLGFAMFEILSRKPGFGQFVFLTLLAVGAVFSGTRSSMLINGLILFYSVSSFKARGGGRYFIGLFRVFIIFSFVVGVPALLTAVQSVANRGDLFANQTDQGGRLYNLIALETFVDQQPWYKILFGDGFGNGTNTAVSLNPDAMNSDSWNRLIDDAFATLYFQGGIPAVILYAGFLIWFVRFGYKKLKAGGMSTMPFLLISVIFIALNFAGNILESYTFIPFYFLGCGLYIGRSSAVRDVKLAPKPKVVVG